MARIESSNPGAIPYKSATGQVFVVDPSVSGSLQDAIDACVDDNGDTIVVQPGSHEVTQTVSFNKQGISVIGSEFGMPSKERGENFTIKAASSYTDRPVATITKPCHIKGLGFQARDLTKEALLVDCQEAGGFSGGFIMVENCRFGVWYGAIAAGIRLRGGAVNKIIGCSFDGLFGGFGTAGIIMENDSAITPAYVEVKHCGFWEVGSGKHAIKHASGSTPLGVLYAHNYLLPGFGGNQGKFLDNTNVASTGMCADNWLAPLATQGAAFENMTNSSIGFADNHYEE